MSDPEIRRYVLVIDDFEMMRTPQGGCLREVVLAYDAKDARERFVGWDTGVGSSRRWRKLIDIEPYDRTREEHREATWRDGRPSAEESR